MSSPRGTRRVHDRSRFAVVVTAVVALLLGSVGWGSPAQAVVGVPTTYLDHTYTSTASPTQDKPQSKLWFHDGAWWALMAGDGTSTVYIHELIEETHSWRNTGVVVDARANSTGDALWSGRDGKLYVASRVAGSGGDLLVNSYSYQASGRSWAVDTSEFVSSGGGSESAAIDQDSTGRLWVTYTRASRVWVAYSNTNGSSWTAGFQPVGGDTTIAADDLSAVVAFGGHSVGVMYSDQESGAVRFAIHKDTDPVDVWTFETVTTEPGMADDHINLKQLTNDPQGRVFAAIKTSKGDLATDSPSDPLIVALTRSSTGAWSFATAATVADGWTRPIITIDSTNQQLYLLATSSEQGGDIVYKRSSLASLSFGGTASKFVDATPVLNNVSGAKDPVTGETGMVVLAAAHGQKRYVHAEMALTAGGKFDGGGTGDPAPTVAGTSPADKATGVSLTTDVTATFSEAVQGVGDDSFTLTDPSGATVPATVGYSSKVATLDPASPLAAGTKYTASLIGGPSDIRDSAGSPLQTTSWSFTTATATTGGDTTPPTVKGRVPAAGATGVGLNVNVSATFSEAVDGVDKSSFTLADPSGAVVPAVVSLSSRTNQWVLNPDVALAKDTRYTVTLNGGSSAIRDRAGNALATTTWQFLTGPPPTISSRKPAPGATGVSRTASITVGFSEAVEGVGSTTFTLKDPSGVTVTAGVSRSGTTNTWILDPASTLAAGTRYTVTVTGGPDAVRDLAGNVLRTISWTITTGSA